jgi:hypothetical protein
MDVWEIGVEIGFKRFEDGFGGGGIGDTSAILETGDAGHDALLFPIELLVEQGGVAFRKAPVDGDEFRGHAAVFGSKK